VLRKLSALLIGQRNGRQLFAEPETKRLAIKKRELGKKPKKGQSLNQMALKNGRKVNQVRGF